jgi:hypothetical protein
LQSLLPDRWAQAHPKSVCQERREEQESVAERKQIRGWEKEFHRRSELKASSVSTTPVPLHGSMKMSRGRPAGEACADGRSSSLYGTCLLHHVKRSKIDHLVSLWTWSLSIVSPMAMID